MVSNIFIRILKLIWEFFKTPISFLKILFAKNFSAKTTVLLFMQTVNTTIRIKKGRITPMKTVLEGGKKPSAFIPEAQDLARRYGKIVGGKAMVSFAETLFGIPTTAHILGGAKMGKNKQKALLI